MRRSRLPVCWLLLLLLVTARAAGQVDFGGWLAPAESLWGLEADAFLAATGGGRFRWLEADNCSALRADGAGMTVLGLPVREVVVRFADDRVAEVTLSLYNRGDAGDLPEAEFRRQVDEALGVLQGHLKTKPADRRRVRRGNYVSVYLAEWRGRDGTIALLWSDTEKHQRDGVRYPYRAEYLTLRLVPAGTAATSISAGAETARQSSPANLARRVVRDPNGDVRIAGLPMVDQGQKGYCAVAAAERLFSYYGMTIDQHELAQIAKSSAERGTSSEIMLEAFKKAGSKLGVRVREHENLDLDSLQDLLSSYNRLARRQKLEKVELTGRAIDVAAVYRRLDPAVLVEARTGRGNDFKRFTEQVGRSVEAGIPVVWSVIVGLYPEVPPPTGFGGHMRLIIGFNRTTGELLYTDTWGAGHELKRLPAGVGYAMTTGVYTIEPRPGR